jgi:hypothetical protein
VLCPAVSIRRDGTITFNRLAVCNFDLRSGQLFSVFYSAPYKIIAMKEVPRSGAGVPLKEGKNGTLIAERALDFLEEFGVLARTREYPAWWGQGEAILVPIGGHALPGSCRKLRSRL